MALRGLRAGTTAGRGHDRQVLRGPFQSGARPCVRRGEPGRPRAASQALHRRGRPAARLSDDHHRRRVARGLERRHRGIRATARPAPDGGGNPVDEIRLPELVGEGAEGNRSLVGGRMGASRRDGATPPTRHGLNDSPRSLAGTRLRLFGEWDSLRNRSPRAALHGPPQVAPNVIGIAR